MSTNIIFLLPVMLPGCIVVVLFIYNYFLEQPPVPKLTDETPRAGGYNRAATLQLVDPQTRQFIEMMTLVIEQHLNDPQLSVKLLSKEMNIGIRQFYRRMAVASLSPADMIREQRFKVVERLLITTSYTIDEIMFRTGFSNRSTFYRLFSQRYGMTPTQYREQQRAKQAAL
ncbi:MAG: AraC family transcriptional regulator [Prevotellaceae bacterium]|jgi:AraC-like DNA-binding protein|nr:AraC family transcriptional regulator [Prevotellaceae bacterium]